MRNSYDSRTAHGYFASEQDQAVQKSRASFIAKTYQLFGASLLAGAGGAYLGLDMVGAISSNYWWIAIPWMLFGMFGVSYFANKPVINLVVLFLFTFVGGIILAPLLNSFIQTGNSNLIANAFASTAVLFGGLSVYAMKTKSDFSSWGKPLMIAFFMIIAISLVNMFFFKSPILHTAIQGIFLLVISGMVLYDTQNIIKGLYRTPVEAALSLYINFFNMFVTLLQIFGIFGGDD